MNEKTRLKGGFFAKKIVSLPALNKDYV